MRKIRSESIGIWCIPTCMHVKESVAKVLFHEKT